MLAAGCWLLAAGGLDSNFALGTSAASSTHTRSRLVLALLFTTALCPLCFLQSCFNCFVRTLLFVQRKMRSASNALALSRLSLFLFTFQYKLDVTMLAWKQPATQHPASGGMTASKQYNKHINGFCTLRRWHSVAILNCGLELRFLFVVVLYVVLYGCFVRILLLSQNCCIRWNYSAAAMCDWM